MQVNISENQEMANKSVFACISAIYDNNVWFAFICLQNVVTYIHSTA